MPQDSRSILANIAGTRISIGAIARQRRFEGIVQTCVRANAGQVTRVRRSLPRSNLTFMTAAISLADVQGARKRIAPFLAPTPFRNYPSLDAVLPDVSLFVKHENAQPTGSFKVRNGLSTLTALDAAQRAAGVVG